MPSSSLGPSAHSETYQIELLHPTCVYTRVLTLVRCSMHDIVYASPLPPTPFRAKEIWRIPSHRLHEWHCERHALRATCILTYCSSMVPALRPRAHMSQPPRAHRAPALASIHPTMRANEGGDGFALPLLTQDVFLPGSPFLTWLDLHAMCRDPPV